MRLSRRSFVGGVIGAAGIGAVPLSRLPRTEPALPARRFLDSLGVCTHPCWRNTVWGSSDWTSPFLEAGFKNTRGEIAHGGSARGAMVDLRKLFADGVKICALIPGRTLDRTEALADITFLADQVGAENLSGIESVNEFNSPRRRPTDWAPKLQQFQRWLHDTVRNNRALDGVPLIAPSIWGRLTEDYRALGNLDPNVDRGCLHYYTGGRRPTRAGVPSIDGETGPLTATTLERAISEARMLAPRRALWMTEFGYRMIGRGAHTRVDVPETVAAKYLVRGLFDAFAEGVEKTFIYALIDDADVSPARYYGMLDASLRPRRAFYALRNLIALVRDEGNARPGVSLRYSLSGVTRSVSRHVFAKSDGTFLIAMYQDVDSYDLGTMREIEIAPQPVSLHFANSAKVEIFDPHESSQAQQTIADTATVTVPVADRATIVKVRFNGPDSLA